MSGRPAPAAIPLAHITPDKTPPMSPGPAVTETASTCASVIPARPSASRTAISSFSAWARAAISGTTPPKPACSGVWPKTTEARTSARSESRRTNAAAVSSQLLSIPSMVSGVLIPALLHCPAPVRQVTPYHEPHNCGAPMPLRLLITRPEPAATGMAEELRAAFPGAEVVVSPLMRITYGGTLPALAARETLIFTSRHGVAGFCRLSPRRDLPACVVGAATAEDARAAGFDVIAE